MSYRVRIHIRGDQPWTFIGVQELPVPVDGKLVFTQDDGNVYTYYERHITYVLCEIEPVPEPVHAPVATPNVQPDEYRSWWRFW